MVRFSSDVDVDELEPLDSIDDLIKLIALLTGAKELGEKCDKGVELPGKEALNDFIGKARKRGRRKLKITYEEFNELLLLLNQDRVLRPFFYFFFTPNPGLNENEYTTSIGKPVDFDEIKNGVRRFRGFALLVYGGFRFAFRELSAIQSYSGLLTKLDPWIRATKQEKRVLNHRTEPLIPLTNTNDEIAGDKTWFVGYISGEALTTDLENLKSKAEELERVIGPSPAPDLEAYRENINALQHQGEQMSSTLEDVLSKARRNTLKYLTWDYMDVYVATSMRHNWEFEETHDFIKQVFKKELTELPKIRWFDPTQSYTESIIDKGLTEALMLKRAKCTVYMAQEGDTLGKDSELAATLAQGKPVIAYVREVKDSKLVAFAQELARRPVSYLHKRFLTLLADGFFEKSDNTESVCQKLIHLKLSYNPEELVQKIYSLVILFSEFLAQKEYLILGDEQEQFEKLKAQELAEARALLAAIESRAFDNRAKTIKSKHPLAMQVHLETGVANGILVARSARTCASLIKGILLQNLHFKIDRVNINRSAGRGAQKTPQKVATALIEEETQSRFRIVTEDECLMNSFWNFYLTKD